jgi:hypothetical protein
MFVNASERRVATQTLWHLWQQQLVELVSVVVRRQLQAESKQMMRLVRQQPMMLVAVCLEGDDDDRAKLKCSDGLQRHFCLKCLKLN